MSSSKGKISQVIGPVVDVRFERGTSLPNIYDALEVYKSDGARVVLEVQSHVGENAIRAISMDSTDGFTRGMEVVSTGIPIKMPTGDRIKGRLFNVVGEAIDGINTMDNTGGLPIHREAPKFDQLSTATEILYTGIKVIDLIEPYAKGGKIGLFGGAGVGKTVLIQELIKTVHYLSGQMERFEQINKELCERINSMQIKTTTGFNEPLVTLGPRLQKINPDTMQIIRVYESASEAMKENHDIKRPSLNKAVVENTVYHGYRWAFVDRELDANVIHNLPPTKKTKQQNLGYIAQLNESKTEIRNVYIDRKTAAHFNGYESASALDNPVKQFTLAKGFYYKLYDQCDEALQIAVEQKIKGKPVLYKNGVHQCDLQNVVVREFECKYDCMKSLSMSDKTLTKALTKGIQYNGHIFKEAGSKLKCI